MDATFKKYAVIVAGGMGTRMGAHIPKQFLLVNGVPVISHTIAAFLKAYDDLRVIVVLPAAFHQKWTVQDRVQAVVGGDTRFHSVKLGLEAIPEEHAVIFVHDGVRCLVTPNLIHRCYRMAAEKGSAVPAVSAVDSLRIKTTDGYKILDRDQVRIIQTPQTFHGKILKAAFQQTYDPGFTDEASVVEKNGHAIHLIQGETDNIKITRPVDLLLAEKILMDRQS